MKLLEIVTELGWRGYFPTKVSKQSHQSMCAVEVGSWVATVRWVTSCLGSVSSAQSCDLILDSLRKELQHEWAITNA